MSFKSLLGCWLTFSIVIIFLENITALSSSCDSISEFGEEESSGSLIEWWKNANTIYDFSVKDIDGNVASLEKYKGLVTLIVNVACYCGYTSSNYAELQKLYRELSETKGLRIAAFPCNQFGAQEPGSHKEIKEFVEALGVTFDIYSKIDVNGGNTHPLYRFLKFKYNPSHPDWNIEWNFSKFLIDKSGKPVAFYHHSTQPMAIKQDLFRYF